MTYIVLYFDGNNIDKLKESKELLYEFFTTAKQVINLDYSVFEIGLGNTESIIADTLMSITDICIRYDINPLIFNLNSWLAYKDNFYISPISRLLNKNERIDLYCYGDS